MEHLSSSVFQKCGRRLMLLASVLGFLYLTIFIPQEGMGKAGLISFGVLILTLGLWITEYFPMAISALFGCFLLYFFGRLFKFDVLVTNSFLGFASPSVWFVFSGLVIGAAMGISGLAKRISLNFLRYSKNSYRNLIFGFLILSGLLVFLIPSTDARTVALMSLVVGMTGFHSQESEHNLMKGLSILIPISSSVMGIGVLASVSSITAVGLIEKYLGIQVSYLKWLVLFLPAEILSMATLYFLITRIFPCNLSQIQAGNYIEQELAKLGPFSEAEKKTTLLIGGAVVLWFTGSLTSLRADVVAMACASALMLPKVGVIKSKDLATKINWLIAPIFLGAAFSIVDCLEATGMLSQIGEFFLSYTTTPLQGEGVLSKMFVICGLSGIMHVFTAHSSMLIASFLPIVLQWASTLHLGLAIPLAFIWGSQFEFLIYQSSALTIAYGYGAISGTDLLKIAFPLILVEFFGGTLLLYGWWQLLGII